MFCWYENTRKTRTTMADSDRCFPKLDRREGKGSEDGTVSFFKQGLTFFHPSDLTFIFSAIYNIAALLLV